MSRAHFLTPQKKLVLFVSTALNHLLEFYKKNILNTL